MNNVFDQYNMITCVTARVDSSMGLRNCLGSFDSNGFQVLRDRHDVAAASVFSDYQSRRRDKAGCV